MQPEKQPVVPFTAYQKFAIFILAITQFTVILDFMVMSPLGDILMKVTEQSEGYERSSRGGYTISHRLTQMNTDKKSKPY